MNYIYARNLFAFKYLCARLEYLKREQQLLNCLDRKNLTYEQKEHLKYLQWLFNLETKKTLNKWLEIEKKIMIKMDLMDLDF